MFLEPQKILIGEHLYFPQTEVKSGIHVLYVSTALQDPLTEKINFSDVIFRRVNQQIREKKAGQ